VIGGGEPRAEAPRPRGLVQRRGLRDDLVHFSSSR
jgi:hypothetical protein